MNKVYRFWIILLGILGGFSGLYFFGLWITLGRLAGYNCVWLCLALVCIGLILAIRYYAKKGRKPPNWVVIPVEILVGVSCILFIIIEALIICAGKQTPPQGADYLIILGAKVNGTEPSLILRYRIEAVAEYLQANPDTMVIASGGQGMDEGISEAQCICEQLVKLGVSSEQIIIEDKSKSTRENLEYSAEFLDKRKAEVVITTTDFHLFRAMQLAKSCGYEHVSGNSAKSVWWLVPTNYTRECLAVLKEFLVGNFRR